MCFGYVMDYLMILKLFENNIFIGMLENTPLCNSTM